MKVVIVDDEPAAHRVLADYLSKYSGSASLVGGAHTALQGIQLIQKHKPDLVLLDIEMAHGNGFELLEAFPDRTFQVIYTSAHPEHAVHAAHTHPFDYLLKPVDPDDLYRALDQLRASFGKNGAKRIEISSQSGKVFLNVKDIVRIEADGGYSTLYLVDGEKYVASKSIGYFEEMLPKERFYRCHHSHLICLPMVKGLENRDGGMIAMGDGSYVPLASRRHAEFADRVGV
jgi:two-component system, LytTR family, response regulator